MCQPLSLLNTLRTLASTMGTRLLNLRHDTAVAVYKPTWGIERRLFTSDGISLQCLSSSVRAISLSLFARWF